MTIIALKEVLQDRINLIASALKDIALENSLARHFWQQGYLYGRLEELRVCQGLIESLQIDEEHPLFELKEDCIRRVPWGEQQRHGWPNSTFAGIPWDWEKQEPMNQDEAEPGKNRYDPVRC